MPKMKVEIVTAERMIYSGEADMVIAPGIEGVLGILPRHAPLLTALQVGELRVKNDGEEITMAIGGGFMEVSPDKVIILADTAERAEEIDIARAEAARERAERLLREKPDGVDLAGIEGALRRSRIRLKVARRRRRPREARPPEEEG
ncbi:MAG: F0F1 ATP synthase subunit epsilon [Anaerolineae bacterium]